MKLAEIHPSLVRNSPSKANSFVKKLLQVLPFYCFSRAVSQGLIRNTQDTFPRVKDVMQRKLFQKCTHLLYCSVLALGGNINTRRILPPNMGSIFHIKKKSMKYSDRRKLLCELSKLSNFMLLTYLDIKQTCIYSCLQIPPRENWFQFVLNCN